MKKRITWCVALLLAIVTVSLSASALTASAQAVNITEQWAELPPLEAAENEGTALHTEYVKHLLSLDGMTQTGGSVAYQGLGANEAKVYAYMKRESAKIASGERASTVFYLGEILPTLDVTTEWTVSALGGNADNANTAFWAQIDLEAVRNALVYDTPYELYWFDKTVGIAMGVSAETTSLGGVPYSVSVKDAMIVMAVAKAYQPTDYVTNAPTADTAKTGVAAQSVAKALDIVREHEGKDDYHKLLAYRDEITSLVSYNNAATAAGTPYGDPWQLVYVFDGDSTTNVVCEGYSKAFQYLCDLSSFLSDRLVCYTVTGSIGEAHMWNVVTMDDGKHYLVDVTNSEAGTLGQNGELFLAGASGSVSSGYTFVIDAHNSVQYRYDSVSSSLWGTGTDSVLSLASSAYVYVPASISFTSGTITYDGSPVSVGTSGDHDIVYQIDNPDFTKVTTVFYQDGLSVPMASTPVSAGTYVLELSASTEDGRESIAERYRFTVQKAKLTVTPSAVTAVYGEAPATHGVSLSFTGFVGEDTQSTVTMTGTPVIEHTYRRYDDVGSYAFTVSGLSAQNYTFEYQSGVLTVSPATVTLTWQGLTGRRYADGVRVSATVHGVLNGDAVAVAVSGGDATAVGSGYVATASLTGGGAGNYVIAEGDRTRTYDIEKQVLTLSPVLGSWTYGEIPNEPTGIPQQALFVSYRFTATGYDSALVPSKVGTYTVTVYAETETAVYSGSTVFSILPKSLTISSVSAQSRPYEKGVTAVTVSDPVLAGLMTGDDVKLDLASLKGAVYADATGEYTTVCLSGIRLTGADAGNYTIAASADVSATVRITQRTVDAPIIRCDTATEPPVVTVYDGENEIPAHEYTVRFEKNLTDGTATVTVVNHNGGNYTVSGSITYALPKADTEPAAQEETDTQKPVKDAQQPTTEAEKSGCGATLSPLSLLPLLALALLSPVLLKKRVERK